MEHIPEESAPTSFSGLDTAKIIAWVRKMKLQSTVNFDSKLTFAGFKNIPSSWILCTKDIILPPDFQRSCIKRIEAGSGRAVRAYELATDHCPNASAPQELAELLAKVVSEAGADMLN
jgi:hypothetical protein